jgi:aminopeptidase-like protein/aminoglycoside N3'-acetyltransferase
MSSAPGYRREDLVHGLREIGAEPGDTIFLHVDLAALGEPRGVGEGGAPGLLLAAVREVVGPGGTILVPTYTFSFCRGEPFDPQRTATVGGPWSPSADFLEFFRAQPGTIRSSDPIHSVTGQGPSAAALLRDLPPTCFGEGSVFHRLREGRGKICMVGLGLEEATLRHHSEEVARAPFRYRKLFTGLIREGETDRKSGWIYNVRILADNGFPDGHRLEARARARGLCRASAVGRGELLVIGARELHELTLASLAEDPWVTARGPAGDPVALESERVGACRPAVSLPPAASMRAMIEGLWRLPRDIVSDGYDAALDALAAQVPMTIHRYPTGLDCWTWLVPEKWTCHEAYLETLDGQRIFSYAEHPLHVVSYSLPFEGEVTREVLLRHLHVHPTLPDAIPFVFKYYERDWGLCCSRGTRERLTEESYRVVIRTSFRYGELAVGETVAPGRSEECVVLCAHLCHPGMANDDLTGVVVGIEVMRRLLARRNLRYTYRLLILPETIGSIAFLSQNESLLPRLRGGLFLEMLGLPNPAALQLSFAGDTEFDRCFTHALREQDATGWTGEFREIIGNDERQFNAPGVRVPMLSLSRVRRLGDPAWPYPEYHSSADTPAAVSWQHLDESADLVERMVDTLERNTVPRNRFKGEVFCSRYGLHIDPYVNPEGHRALFDIMYLIDGTRSIAQIASTCQVSFGAVEGVVAELERHGLVSP